MRLAFSAALIVLSLVCSNAFAVSRGGSNYNWYRVDGCSREPYGVISNYHVAKPTIDAQLQQFRAAGQDRLRLGIFHARGLNTGTVMDSTGGTLAQQQLQNMQDLLAAVKIAGFHEVEIAFHPVGNNNPIDWSTSTNWTAFHESYFQENWNLIHNLMPIIRGSGVPYRVDLGNEMSPPSNANRVWQEYVRKLWLNFNIRFNREESLGFSISGDAAVSSRISNLNNVYSGLYPYLLDFHFYDDAYNRFIAADNALRSRGLNHGLIVGETYYNDRQSAEGLANAINATGREVYYLAQWPWSRNSSCSDVDVVPADFDHYIINGF